MGDAKRWESSFVAAVEHKLELENPDRDSQRIFGLPKGME
jgi:hypothetical protein